MRSGDIHCAVSQPDEYGAHHGHGEPWSEAKRQRREDDQRKRSEGNRAGADRIRQPATDLHGEDSRRPTAEKQDCDVGVAEVELHSQRRQRTPIASEQQSIDGEQRSHRDGGGTAGEGGPWGRVKGAGRHDPDSSETLQRGYSWPTARRKSASQSSSAPIYAHSLLGRQR